MKKESAKTMQEQQYQSFSYESEIAYGRQDMRDVWSEGEKLRPELQRQKKKEGVLQKAILAVVIALLLVVFLFGGMLISVSKSHAVHAVPAPIQKPYLGPIQNAHPVLPTPKPYPAPIQNP